MFMPVWPLLLPHHFAYSSTPGHNHNGVHVCAFHHATCVTFMNYNHLCSSQNWAPVSGKAHFLQFSDEYVSFHTPLCTSDTWVCIFIPLPQNVYACFLSSCCAVLCITHASVLLSSPSCLSLTGNICSLFKALRSHSKCSGCHFETLQSEIRVIEGSIQRSKVTSNQAF